MRGYFFCEENLYYCVSFIDYDLTLKRPVSSRYAEGLFNQLMRPDGKMFNVSLILYNIIVKVIDWSLKREGISLGLWNILGTVFIANRRSWWQLEKLKSLSDQ